MHAMRCSEREDIARDLLPRIEKVLAFLLARAVRARDAFALGLAVHLLSDAFSVTHVERDAADPRVVKSVLASDADDDSAEHGDMAVFADGAGTVHARARVRCPDAARH